jgi:gliding motility-associated-like protein
MKKITLLFCFCLILQYAHANSGTPKIDEKSRIAKLLPPGNDECATAAPLTVNGGQGCNSTTTVNFFGATISPQANSCAATTTADIWYQFIATNTSHSISLSNFTGTAQPVIMALYQGTDCDAMTQLYCSANNYISATGLTLGETYKLRVYFSVIGSTPTTTFSICVNTPPPPANNNNPVECLIGTVNYSFENPAPPATTFPIFLNHNTVQGWRTTASDQMMEFWPTPNYENVPAYEGIQFIELNANLVSAVYQDYTTPQPTVFTYGFAHRGRQGIDTCELQAGPPGGPYTTVTTATTGNTSWSYYTGTYTVPAGQPVTRFLLQSVSSVGGVSVGNYLDAITFTANNGILSANPYYLNCGETTASVSAAGVGSWSAHADNPSPTTIDDPDANDTDISGFLEPGTYYFEWTTEYCESTLEVQFTGPEPPAPVVTNVVYCQNQEAVPLEAEALPGYIIYWFATGDVTPPTPNTSAVGSTNYYVSQSSPSGCESVPSIITVTVNGLGASVTDFTLPDSACMGSGTITPTMASNFTGGGEFTADDAGLAIDPVTGAIDMDTSTEGTYMVTYAVEADPDNCILNSDSSTEPISVVALPAVPATTAVQPSCASPTGTITVNSPLGSNLNYSINDGASWQVSNVFSGLSSGEYVIMVQNATGCVSSSAPVTIDVAPPVPPTPVVDDTQPGCNELTGAIAVTSPAGAQYVYSIDGTNFQPEMLFSDVAPGTYTVTVQNTDGCESSTLPFVINNTPLNPDVATTDVTQPECNPTGVIEVTAPTGTGYTYSINGSTFQTTAVFAGLAPGDYTVTTHNASGCESVTGTITLNPGFAVPAVADYDLDPASCNDPTATITINSPLGAGLDYTIDGINYQTDNVFDSVTQGIYTVTVRNISSGCESHTDSVFIGTSSGIPAIATYTVTPPSCGQPNATITINSPLASGLSYSITSSSAGFQTSPVFNNVPPGTYTIYVKNAAQCESVTNPFTINVGPATPAVPVTTVIEPACTVPNGTITVTSPLAAGNTYSIDGVTYQAGTVFANVVPGMYSVTVKNADGCTAAVVTIVHAAPGSPAVAGILENDPACGETTGSITVTSPIGGGVTYSIDGGVTYQASTVFDDLAPGNYVITVKNNAGCLSATAPITIDTPPLPSNQGTITGTDEICLGETTQLANTVTGGTWAGSNDAVATVDVAGLVTSVGPGVVTVTYTVPGPCPDAAQLDVIVHALPNPQLDDEFLCLNLETNEYTAVNLDSGLSAGYDFQWTKGGTVLPDTTGAIIVNEPGDYAVTATNSATGCVGTASSTVGVSSVAVVSAEVGQDFHYNQTITVTVSGGSGDYEYQLDNGPFQDEPYFTNIYEGEYTITVRDKNGCGESEKLFVYALNYPRYFSPNGDGKSDVWNIDGLLGQQRAVIYIFDRYGKIVGSAKPGIAGWDGTYNGKNLPATDYWFTIQYTSSNGKEKEFKAHFSLLR